MITTIMNRMPDSKPVGSDGLWQLQNGHNTGGAATMEFRDYGSLIVTGQADTTNAFVSTTVHLPAGEYVFVVNCYASDDRQMYDNRLVTAWVNGVNVFYLHRNNYGNTALYTVNFTLETECDLELRFQSPCQEGGQGYRDLVLCTPDEWEALQELGLHYFDYSTLAS